MARMFPGVRGAGAALAVAAGIVVAGAPARATESTRLVYVRGPGARDCAGEAAIRDAVRERLGYDPFFVAARDTLFVEIQRRGRQLQTQVRLLDGDNVERGARKLSVVAADCSALIATLSLTISLTIDPARIAQGPPTADSSLAPPQRETIVAAASAQPASRAQSPGAVDSGLGRGAVAVAVSAPVPTPGTAPRSRVWSARAGLAAVASLTGAPATTGGLAVFAGFTGHRLSLELELRADAPVTGDSTAPPARVRSWLVAAFLVPCAHLGPTFACPVIGAGVMGASARDVAVSADRRGPWSAIGGRVGAEMALSAHLLVRAHAELLGNLTRNYLLVDGAEVYRVPRLAASVGIALAWRFP